MPSSLIRLPTRDFSKASPRLASTFPFPKSLTNIRLLVQSPEPFWESLLPLVPWRLSNNTANRDCTLPPLSPPKRLLLCLKKKPVREKPRLRSLPRRLKKPNDWCQYYFYHSHIWKLKVKRRQSGTSTEREANKERLHSLHHLSNTSVVNQPNVEGTRTQLFNGDINGLGQVLHSCLYYCWLWVGEMHLSVSPTTYLRCPLQIASDGDQTLAEP